MGTLGGIAATFADLIAAVVSWVVSKLRGEDLFDQVVREAESHQAGQHTDRQDD